MARDQERRDRWERLLEAERKLQSLVPGSVLVGESAAALHAGRRISLDGDHVLPDLKDRFAEILRRLEDAEGWKTERAQPPVLILGELDGCLTGVRQLIRAKPLELDRIAGLVVPSLAEMARIKGWLLIHRDTVRDYLDTAVLLEKVGESGLEGAYSLFDDLYRREAKVASPLAELIERLATAKPSDRNTLELTTYKNVRPPWNDWAHVEERGRYWAGRLTKVLLEP